MLFKKSASSLVSPDRQMFFSTKSLVLGLLVLKALELDNSRSQNFFTFEKIISRVIF